VVEDSPHLNKQYTAFGKVTGGLDVVDKIVAEERDGNDNPLKSVEMTIKVVED
jgi:peptidyl-prolyl cis-trans isomerase B (cyclophilin B)